MKLVIAVAALLAFAVVVWALWWERGSLMRRSTWRMLRETGASLEGYIYGRFTNQYISVLIHHIFPRLGEDGGKWLSDRYHGKVLTHDQANAIINLDAPIRRDLEKIVPYPIARDLILNAPPEVAAYECGCRHARANPCQPTQVCMVMGEPVVSFILEHHPTTSKRLTQAEALELLHAEHERGHLHSAWFKNAVGNRFYAICNCCKCCCGGIEAMAKYGFPMVASSGFVACVDEGLCNSCENCVPMCPFDALSMNGIAHLDWDHCMGCGVCVGQCPVGAVTLVRDEKKGVPLDVRALA